MRLFLGPVVVIMLVVWIGYMISAIVAITNLDPLQIAAAALALPLVLVIEWLGMEFLDLYAAEHFR